MTMLPILLLVVCIRQETFLTFVSEAAGLLVGGLNHHGNSGSTAYLLYGHIVHKNAFIVKVQFIKPDINKTLIPNKETNEWGMG